MPTDFTPLPRYRPMLLPFTADAPPKRQPKPRRRLAVGDTCPNGHRLTAADLTVNTQGTAICKICRRQTVKNASNKKAATT